MSNVNTSHSEVAGAANAPKAEAHHCDSDQCKPTGDTYLSLQTRIADLVASTVGQTASNNRSPLGNELTLQEQAGSAGASSASQLSTRNEEGTFVEQKSIKRVRWADSAAIDSNNSM